jgi:hypothetical protein
MFHLISKIIKQLKGNIANNDTYYTLSPQNDIKHGKIKTYLHSLSWAINNSKTKNIRNIAITGVYGSGKSSILNTFQKENKGRKEWRFLNISLATFNDAKNGSKEFSQKIASEDEEIKEPEERRQPENLQRLIELSILQQLLYHEKDGALQDSRIRKIRKTSSIKTIGLSIGVFLFLISLANIITGYISYALQIFLQRIFLNYIPVFNNVIYFISLSICIIGCLFILIKLVRLFQAITLKLNFKNAEIKIDANISKSVLNHYLDEIIYFFESTKYNIVIIEDLDRFEQVDVFTKLREINLLLNTSKKIKRIIIFIYAIRDDMFKGNKDRTKFFDFIIPIIPIIDKSNSGDFLLNARRENNIDISDSVIDDLSLFIDDMRLLNNIINEYRIYREYLNPKLDKNKLFALLFYKNLFPKDFTKLNMGEGILYTEINSKQIIIQERIKDFDEKIKQNELLISDLESLKIRNVNELRSLYIFEYLKYLPNLICFQKDGVTYNFTQLLDPDVFIFFINDSFQYSYYMRNNYNSNIQQMQTQVPKKFVDIEKKVDPNFNYHQRIKQITDYTESKTAGLQRQNDDFILDKANIKSKKLAEVYRTYSTEEVTNKQLQIIKILLQFGYIDEDYFDYVSLFHKGSITQKDADFIINIKMGVSTDFDYKLDQVEHVIQKLQKRDVSEFEKIYILNYYLMDFLLTNTMYQSLTKNVYSILCKTTKNSLEFIDGYIARNVNTGVFINELCNSWQDFWDYIKTKTQYSDDKKDNYFKIIIEYVSLENIEKQDKSKMLTKIIEHRKDYFTIISDKNRLQEIIKRLNLKFHDIDIQTLDDKIFMFISQGNHYFINPDMLTVILTYKKLFNRNLFDTQNFSLILNSGYIPLIEYINTHMLTYVDDVYLKLPNNTNDPEEVFLQLLNNKMIPIDKKSLIIQKVSTKLSTLDNVDDIDVKRTLMEKSKVSPTWITIIKFFHEENDEITDPILLFINNHENADVISKTKIDKEIPDKKTVEKYILMMLANNDISDEVYALITKSIPYWYDSLAFEYLSLEKITSLIDNVVLQISNDNVSKLKSIFTPLHIRLLVKYPDKLFEKWDTLTLDASDYVALFKSTFITLETKNKIYNKIAEKIIIDNIELLNIIAELIIDNPLFTVTEAIIKAVLLQSNLPTKSKISIFNINADKIFEGFITTFLQNLGSPYSDITIHGSRPKLLKNDINKKFASILEEKKYISTQSEEDDGIRINTKRG